MRKLPADLNELQNGGPLTSISLLDRTSCSEDNSAIAD